MRAARRLQGHRATQAAEGRRRHRAAPGGAGTGLPRCRNHIQPALLPAANTSHCECATAHSGSPRLFRPPPDRLYEGVNRVEHLGAKALAVTSVCVADGSGRTGQPLTMADTQCRPYCATGIVSCRLGGCDLQQQTALQVRGLGRCHMRGSSRAIQSLRNAAWAEFRHELQNELRARPIACDEGRACEMHFASLVPGIPWAFALTPVPCTDKHSHSGVSLKQAQLFAGLHPTVS